MKHKGNLPSTGISVDADYPGGNIILDRVVGDTVHLEQDIRDTTIWWFYWNFRVRHAQNRSLRFVFSNEHTPESIRNDKSRRHGEPVPIGTRGPAVSLDRGKTWNWLGPESVTGRSFRYGFSPAARDVRFCFSIPHIEANLKAFLKIHHGNAFLSVHPLCATRKGRVVERIHLGPAAGEPECRVLLTARHHCCESIASYTMEGLMQALLADPALDWLRRNAEFLVIPFVDKDGVEDGDQGKSRAPRDHNRDYDGESIHPSVRAIREFVPPWAQGRLRVAIDLHCPAIRGKYNEEIYLVGSESPAIWEQQSRFGEILESVSKGPLPYLAADNLPFGQSWNTKESFTSGKTFGQWAAEQEGIRLATSIEIPYANVKTETVTADNARAFGRDLAHAIRQYLQ